MELSKREKHALNEASTYEESEWIELGAISGIGDVTIKSLVEKGLAEFQSSGELELPVWRIKPGAQ